MISSSSNPARQSTTWIPRLHRSNTARRVVPGFIVGGGGTIMHLGVGEFSPPLLPQFRNGGVLVLVLQAPLLLRELCQTFDKMTTREFEEVDDEAKWDFKIGNTLAPIPLRYGRI